MTIRREKLRTLLIPQGTDMEVGKLKEKDGTNATSLQQVNKSAPEALSIEVAMFDNLPGMRSQMRGKSCRSLKRV